MPKKTFLNLEEKKKESIMRSAVNEFSEQGFEKANVGNIAKNANVSKGSIYQYFNNKKELFFFSVKWSTDFIGKKYGNHFISDTKDINIFDLFHKNSKSLWVQMREERKLIIFVQDVFLGKYKNLTDESMSYMMDILNEYTLKLIQNGKKNGSIREDIDDNMLSIFITAVSMGFKEHMMRNSRENGRDIVDEDFEINEKEIKSMIELLKNGMGGK
ncbi:TetR/AcrR family transcriptional regulator [Clostridium kluyveri]|uniref:TetR family transcriptional regulator n=1 Tax=Clostridium kluyveri TaxID=1534 RepID=A0A1L5F983_CLOKL|nr:TetR/AcrR family transcriptional regulator [Clostridium kluyveri]APM39533.1 TetR family transcriptional regulator [Clostridium kluyveri]UZQ50306.1 TetR/AcrR family transcriptional regulator [Clostridium kluyveri]